MHKQRTYCFILTRRVDIEEIIAILQRVAFFQDGTIVRLVETDSNIYLIQTRNSLASNKIKTHYPNLLEISDHPLDSSIVDVLFSNV